MVAVQLASIIVGAISLVGIIGAAGVTAYFTYWSDKRKRHIDAVASLNEYYDPLLIAAVTLRHKIRRLAGDYGHDEYTGGRRGGTYYEPMNPDSRHDGATSSSGGNSYLVTHTAFLVANSFLGCISCDRSASSSIFSAGMKHVCSGMPFSTLKGFGVIRMESPIFCGEDNRLQSENS